VLILAPMLLVVGGSAVAYAADALPFTDISGHWAEQAIENLAARGIIAGHADGTFGPDEVVTRAQVATFLDRLNTEAMAPVAARRGCPDCHTGPYSLKNEAVGASAAVHAGLEDSADIAACSRCHAPGTGARAGKGNAAPLSMRDIVHSVHMGSKIFATEFVGNCFSCHNVSGDGTYQILTLAVDTNDAGIPNQLPIPGAVNPPVVASPVPSTTTTTAGTTTTTVPSSTTTTGGTTTTTAINPAALYAQYCRGCHSGGVSGTASSIQGIVTNGVGSMPGYSSSMTGAQIAALAAYAAGGGH
jgi:mono/diheme cytochrome c family protein